MATCYNEDCKLNRKLNRRPFKKSDGKLVCRICGQEVVPNDLTPVARYKSTGMERLSYTGEITHGLPK